MKKEIVRIKLNKIIPNKNQPRLDFYDDSINGAGGVDQAEWLTSAGYCT